MVFLICSNSFKDSFIFILQHIDLLDELIFLSIQLRYLLEYPSVFITILHQRLINDFLGVVISLSEISSSSLLFASIVASIVATFDGLSAFIEVSDS